MECENCKKIQNCNKTHSGICKKFDLYGEKPLKPRKSKELCFGCRNEFGSKGCMSYKTSKVVLKSYQYSLNHRPPWILKWKLDCFQRKW